MHHLVIITKVCEWAQNGASKDAPYGYGAKRITMEPRPNDSKILFEYSFSYLNNDFGFVRADLSS